MNIEEIRELVQLMVDNDMSRIEIQEGETHILLRRGQPMVGGMTMPAVPMAASAPAPAVPVAASAGPSDAPAEAPASGPAADGGSGAVIRSPMVGTFYTASDPDSPPFVKVGDTVGPDTTVCLIEAMKVFNEIKAEISGRIAKILIQNGQAVEFDQPLFEIEPA